MTGRGACARVVAAALAAGLAGAVRADVGSGAAAAGSAVGGSSAGSGAAVVIPLTPELAAPEVTAVASPSQVELGRRLSVFVTATYGDGVEVNLREPVELGASFELARRSSHDARARDGRHVREWQLEVIAWDVGDLAIPPIAVTFTAAGRAAQVQTSPVPVRVVGLVADADDAKQLRGDHAPVALAGHGWLWRLVIGYPLAIPIAAAVLVAVWMVLRARRRRRRRLRALVAGVAAVPARLDMTTERALERLLALEQSGALDRDAERKAGYAEMVAVLRELLAERHRVALADRTTSELLAALAAVAPEVDRAALAAWLERCDLVKYGAARPTPEDAAAALAGARALVLAAAPREEAA